jgi:hypothetical protein
MFDGWTDAKVYSDNWDITMRDKKKSDREVRTAGAVEVICLKCKRTEILYVPTEEIPKCPNCNIRMTINEILREGKSY